MHHHTENEEGAINLSILALSGTGEFFRVGSDEAVDSTPGGHQQNESCTCYNREARRPAKHDVYIPCWQE